jgi:hypothetical protein
MWPCASPSVPASRFHTAIHGVRLCLGGGIHDRRVAALPLLQPELDNATGQLTSSRELRPRPLSAAGEWALFPLEHLSRPPTHPAKTFRWRPAIGRLFQPIRHNRASHVALLRIAIASDVAFFEPSRMRTSTTFFSNQCPESSSKSSSSSAFARTFATFSAT